MKSIRLFLVLVIAFAAFGMFPGTANAQQFTSYTSGVNIQNLGSANATITISFYNAGTNTGGGGTSAASVNDSITGFGVKNYFPLTAVASGFKGSVVISSSQAVAAVTNIAKSDMTVLGAYNGTSVGSTTVHLPILHKNNGGFNSWYSVMNVGTSVAQVTIDYSSTPNNASDVTLAIAPNASVTVAQKDETMHGTTKLFAGTVRSTNNQPLVVVALQENVGNILAYTGFTSGSKFPVMPTINMNNSGYITGTQIFNLSDTSTDVTVSYKTGGQFGSDCAETKTIPGKSMVVFTSGAFGTTTQAGENCVNGQRFLGSAKVTANTGNADLAVVVNQLRTAPSISNGSSYNGFDPAKANSTVFMPTIFDRNSGWYTAFNVMNVGDAPTYVKCTFAGSTKVQTTDQLAAGASKTFSQLNFLQDKYIGSAVCKAYTDNTYTTENTAAKIVTVVNQLGTGSPDNLLSYEGINP